VSGNAHDRELITLYRGADGVRRLGTVDIENSLAPTMGTIMPEYDVNVASIVIHGRKPALSVVDVPVLQLPNGVDTHGAFAKGQYAAYLPPNPTSLTHGYGESFAQAVFSLNQGVQVCCIFSGNMGLTELCW
jgi:hypothetical protein